MKAVIVVLQMFCLLSSFFVLPICAEDRATDVIKSAKTADVETDIDAGWIWSPSQTKNKVPVGDCFFRKTFTIANPEAGQVQISADNRFELFVNGQPVATGNDWRQMQIHDVTELLKSGENTVAVRATNTDEGAAGLVARVIIKERGGTFQGFSTDQSWKTSIREFQGWTLPNFSDKDWIAAVNYGTLGATLPWGDEVVIAGEGRRFIIGQEFNIKRVMRDEDTGSLIAMAFDAKGNILASQEGGPLLRIVDSNHDGDHDTVNIFCDKIKNVQGILALGTRVFAVGDGLEGSALYRLRDADRDGKAEEITMLVPFRGSKGEHSPHAIRLGPDGMLYVIVGNHARVGLRPSPRSPYRNWYEGDLVRPRYEDPQGHAVGIPAPGGTLFRTDTSGSFVELVAGGLRNAYDFAFSPDGELFTYDADMEWDLGAPWYRPTRINHITAGAELGWRSGWAKWPTYYLDSLPATLDIGPGSPTGVEFYDHTAFPESYRGALFACDWATGKIHCIRFKQDGATYKATDEVFVEGRPMNVTDLAVGPDGALYFCTGGRGTDGGVYRLRWEGKADTELVNVSDKLGEGVDRALRQPQFNADWARAKIATVKRELGEQWAPELIAACKDANRLPSERLRAVDLMIFYGPRPTDALLLSLSNDAEPAVRRKAARLMFTSRDEQVGERLVAMLADEDAQVRRVACETLMRRVPNQHPNQHPNSSPNRLAEALVKLLADEDRFVAFAARRALEMTPTDLWEDLVLSDANGRLFLRGAVGLLAAKRDAATARKVLGRCEEMLSVKPSVELLRVVQLALIHGKLAARDVPELSSSLLAVYPTKDHPQNRELVRLLVYLQEPGATARMAEQLASDIPLEEKLHIGAYAGRLESGWETESKLVLLNFYETARTVEGGYSVSAYVEQFARDFLAKLPTHERQHLLAQGEQWPASALSVLAKLPANPGREILAVLRQLDMRIEPLRAESDKYRRLQVGIVAVLGRSGEPASLDYLRTVYRDQPERRTPVAMSLTQQPGEENWPYLVDALKTVEGTVAREVLASLTKVPHRPQDAEPFRTVLLQGLRLRGNGASDAIALLEHWSGAQSPNAKKTSAGANWEAQLAAWQQWYAQTFPEEAPAELPQDTGNDKWSYDELLAHLKTGAGKAGDVARGSEVFSTAQCASCHRCKNLGPSDSNGFGPDLTTLGQRFQRKEILESIVYPSHVISDQYASKLVIVNGRPYSGLVIPRGQAGITLLLADGQKLQIAHEQIDNIMPSRQSVMPAGLMNPLTLEQVADLFAFLSEAAKPVNVAPKPRPQTRKR